ncbi:unnamed protein product [Tetraodon nigroviridis]|uniref:(spotted green pufferfish) hypothetical protein n=1 Tax=Tetraodon nigroviridis TaxID=99883 RepID=Q4SNP2_TETNG|nr:unnamed protein product [Tetraodon nigroviridis]
MTARPDGTTLWRGGFFTEKVSLSPALSWSAGKAALQRSGDEECDNKEVENREAVGFQFRTWNEAGFLLTFALAGEGGVAWLYLSEARLRLQIHRAGRVLLQLSAGSALSDGQWHTMKLSSRPGRLAVSVDGDEEGAAHPSSFIAEGPLFFGGCPPEGETQACRNTFGVFQGCMRLLSVGAQPVDFMTVQQRLLGNYSQLQIDMCGITDRWEPLRHLPHSAFSSHVEQV